MLAPEQTDRPWSVPISITWGGVIRHVSTMAYTYPGWRVPSVPPPFTAAGQPAQDHMQIRASTKHFKEQKNTPPIKLFPGNLHGVLPALLLSPFVAFSNWEGKGR
ncbi:hypothetical protein B296_00055264 [Ensete ventricosum]|uniref:Uncharacterized protein n=1 Tax=Ensete ventricosum TaxID=4639 RepID=A0A426XGF4_ENSVE|nr:hypothetical protein B296_00055264 [Ensete ventricosum]